MPLALSSFDAPGKQQEIDGKVAEMTTAGWSLLGTVEASPLLTLRSWGGGVTLQFVRSATATAVDVRPESMGG